MANVVLIQASYKKKHFNDEGIAHKITLTQANVAETMIRTSKKMVSDRLQLLKAFWDYIM